jgi:glycosyltransferase involved in cell wall biosynthesis
MSSTIEMMGYQDNPYTFIQEADCLLLGSRYEGFPNVVLEANACGVPAIAFNSPGGISEIIKDGFNGWLVKDDDIHAFSKVIESKVYLSVDKDAINRFVQDSYSVNKIILEYEETILETVNSM